MNTKLKKTLITLTTTLSAILIVSTATYAIGTLTPQGNAGDDTHYSLNDIYDKLTDFSTSTAATSSPFTVPGTVSSTFATLSEIYTLLEAEDADLVAGNIKSGTTIFGVVGSYTASAPALQWSAQTDGQTWAQATLLCSTLTEADVPAGTWRMPTRYELQDAIQEDYGSFEYDTYYWSGTEYSSGIVWGATWFDSMSYDITDKSNTLSVRCVR